MNWSSKSCILAMPTGTAAEKGRRLAQSAGISAEVVAVDPNITRNGCAFGLRFDCGAREELVAILKKRRVNFGEIIGQ